MVPRTFNLCRVDGWINVCSLPVAGLARRTRHATTRESIFMHRVPQAKALVPGRHQFARGTVSILSRTNFASALYPF